MVLIRHRLARDIARSQLDSTVVNMTFDHCRSLTIGLLWTETIRNPLPGGDCHPINL